MCPTEGVQAMGIEANQDALCSIKKALRCSIRTSCRCASEHRAVFSVAILLYLLYRCSPRFFVFLLSSPVVLCTTLLLALLLSYGIKDHPEIDDKGKAPSDVSAPKLRSSSRDVPLKEHQTLPVPAVEENIIMEASFGRMNSNRHVDLDESVPLLKGVHQRNQRVDTVGRLDKIADSAPSMETMQQEVHMEEHMQKPNSEQESKDACLSKENVRDDVEMLATPNHGRECTDLQSDDLADSSEHKTVERAAGKCKWGRAFSVRRRKKLADIKIEAINPAVENQPDYSLSSPSTGVGSHDFSSGFDPDSAERYSPDAHDFMIDAAPGRDETTPLLDADCSCPGPINNDGSDNHSIISSHDSKTDSDSNDVADNSKAKDIGDEKQLAEQEPAVLWTADDDKNVMDLGYSEIERNRRLEMLMVKRKSRKHMIVDLDGGSCSPTGVQPISIPPMKMNPFADEADMPGSAPSILHPRKNAFDFFDEQSNDTGVPLPAPHNMDTQDFVPVQNQGMFFKRHESFNCGRPQRHVPRFKPCFVLEEFNFEEGSTSDFKRQFSDKSVSRLSVVSECDTVSSVGDQEHNELIRNYIRGVRESPSLVGQDSDLVHSGDECLDGISFVDNETLNAVIC
ncbi:hypothetical protein ACP4OV_028748 [Aristida adscensionis]